MTKDFATFDCDAHVTEPPLIWERAHEFLTRDELDAPAGKLVCGFLGARLGVLPTVLITEGATAAGILALLPLPIDAALSLLPIIGVALNGTSSVLYGTVPDLVTADSRESAFGVFYTGTIGAGALSPVLYGLISDAIGLTPAMLLVAAIVLLTLPLAWKLTGVLNAVASDLRSPTSREVP